MASSDIAPITINDRQYRQIKEGQAIILAPYQKDLGKPKKDSAQAGQPRNNDEGNQAVFYNPIQQYNRDLSVLAILTHGESSVALKKQKHEKNVNRSRQKKAAKGKQGANAKTKNATEAGLVQASTTKPTDCVANSGAGDYGQTDGSGNPQTEVNGTEMSSRKRTADEAELNEGPGTIDWGRKRSRDGKIDAGADIEVQQLNPGAAGPHTSAAAAQDPSTDDADVAQHEVGTSEKRARPTPFTILDALSASGLRAVRYAKEIPFTTKVVANDMLPEAVQAIKLNIDHNNLKDTVFANLGDARQFMYSKSGNEALDGGPAYVHKFDVVDLDPYGSAAPFIDAALQAVADGGMLCVTCTDAGVWASNGYPEKAYALYSGIPLKGPHSHEAGLRLILHSIATTASKYSIAIEPLLSLSIDFYCRLFIRVHKSQQDVKLMAGTTMLVYNCDQGCQAWDTQLIARNQAKEAKNGEQFFKHGFAQAPSTDRFCDHCGTKTHLGGPMWAGPLHNPLFVQKILDRLPDLDKAVYGTTERMRGMLTVALEEESFDSSIIAKPGNQKSVPGQSNENTIAVIPRLEPQLISPSPLFFLPTYLAKVLSIPTPAEDPLRGAFLGLGYTCTRSHCKPGSFKTNAPWKVIWEVMREWARQKEASRIPRLFGEAEFEGKASVKKSSPGWNILKRMRNRKGDNLSVAKLREALLQKLGTGQNSDGVETVTDLQNILKSALYELEHPSTKASHAVIEPSTTHDRVNTDDHAADTSSTNDMNIVIPTKNGADHAVSDAHVPRTTGKCIIDAGGDPAELAIVFDAQLGRAFRESNGGKLVRYQINPRANWGPMVRAGTGSA
ncbi:RNA methyltransferase tRNA(m5U54)methyltransferase [Exophiala xenobiotica]|uniref:tRNA (guanine(26)-N(2))-dimethyltransferase n=1 Tax=Lithohypha guttulata TaxID=1690604 RepID=A0ABR0KC80_9EURO|nr:RNA methyltransferase tRNA(m5U54)methyltransferase [Lithohypha guttulata]KAK5319948.1 RNA methyltransferase tRNA(m5U54)methyltransferase [Exophiala xenobiotica]